MDMDKMMNGSPKEARDMLVEMFMDAMIDAAGDNEKVMLRSVKLCKRINTLENQVVKRAREDIPESPGEDLPDEKGEAWRTMLRSLEACVNILETALEECRIGTQSHDPVD